MITQNLLPYDGEAYYYPQFLPPQESECYLKKLIEKVVWHQPKIKLFGKEYLTPRLTAWYGDENAIYTYSGIKNYPQKWFYELLTLKNRVEDFCNTNFNAVMLNWYRNGKDSMGWHADDESELGDSPIIASLSLGLPRIFQLRHKANKKQKISLRLEDGSLLLMRGLCQHCWEHSLPKQNHIKFDRINLTFRKIVKTQ